jgi:hypothetical protein
MRTYVCSLPQVCVPAGTEQHRMREAGVVGGGSAMGHTGTHSEYQAVRTVFYCRLEAGLGLW